jgi:hypothetical protein
MATFGEFPGVRVTTTGGGIAAVDVGSEEKVVIFGGGDASAGAASVNEPTQIGSNRDAEVQFGDSELAQAMRDARANGANIDFLYGVMYEKVSSDPESFSGVQTGTLANAPIVEDLSTLTVTDTVDDEEPVVEFRYAESLSTPTDGSTVFVNPLTGDWSADSSSDYDFDYQYPDWQSALDSASRVVGEGETGIYVTLSEAESVASMLSGTVSGLRSEYKLVTGVAGAEPNDNGPDNGPLYDTATYTDAVDSDAQFLAAPVRQANSTETVLAGVGGLFAGNDITNPVFNDPLSGFTELQQKITKSEESDLADSQVIPIRQAGSIRLKRSTSTSTSDDFERDFFTRRIVDRSILIAQQVGDSVIGRINNESTREAAEDLIRSELQELADDGLIEGNANDNIGFTVEVTENASDPTQVDIDIGVSPFGVVKRIDASITIDST